MINKIKNFWVLRQLLEGDQGCNFVNCNPIVVVVKLSSYVDSGEHCGLWAFCICFDHVSHRPCSHVVYN